MTKNTEIDKIIIGESKKILELKFLIEKVASSESTVLVLGETGTGKELVAQALHKSSKEKVLLFLLIVLLFLLSY